MGSEKRRKVVALSRVDNERVEAGLEPLREEPSIEIERDAASSENDQRLLAELPPHWRG